MSDLTIRSSTFRSDILTLPNATVTTSPQVRRPTSNAAAITAGNSTAQENNQHLEQIQCVLDTVDWNLKTDDVVQVALDTPEAVIDLTNGLRTPMQFTRRSFNNDQVIDLCSPDYVNGVHLPVSASINNNPITGTSLREASRLTRRQHHSHSPLSAAATIRNDIISVQINNKSNINDDGNTNNTNAETQALLCPVCMECFIGKQPSTTKCGHVFCGSCINQAIRLTHKCPICNKRLNSRGISRIYL